MLLARALLAFNGFIFALYGAMCLVDPTSPSDLAGLTISNPSGSVEVMAMYGGLQLAVGLYLLAAMLKPHHLAKGLELLALVMAGLGIARLIGTAVYGVDSYNLTVGSYEIVCCLLALYLRTTVTKTTT